MRTRDLSSVSVFQRFIFQNRFLDNETKAAASYFVRFAANRLRSARSRIFYGHYVRSRNITNYLNSHSVRKLHFGAGPIELEGFLNTDLFGKVPVDITRRLPFEDETIDLIYSNHVVEHITKEDFKYFLQESLRILKKNGVNIMSMPSIQKVSTLLFAKNQDLMEPLKKHFTENFMEEDLFTPSEYLNLIMRGFDHKFLYDFQLIDHLAAKAGYSSVTLIDNSILLDPTLTDYSKKCPESWELETETFVLTK